MPLYITSLNSGSNGNCYYIGNGREAILIDAGISCRETEKRLSRLGLSMEQVKGIFISHEHSDHIKGVTVLAKKYRLPIYITAKTMQHGGLNLSGVYVVPFFAHEPVEIGEFTITPFPKIHDAAEPHSFIISSQQINIGVLTDIGAPCEQVIRYFSQCHAVFLEANYDEQMLEQGTYPVYLKHRIRGGQGHLSNRQALELFIKHRPSYLSHLLLSHLSQNNNHPRLVQQLFEPHAGKTVIVIASRMEETPVYTVGGGTAEPRVQGVLF